MRNANEDPEPQAHYESQPGMVCYLPTNASDWMGCK